MAAEQEVLDAVTEEEHEAPAVEEPDEAPKPAAQHNGAATGANTTTQVARRPDRTPLSQRDPVGLAQHFAASGYFKDARSMSQAVVKIVAGEELGFGPMTAMAGIHLIEGKPSLSANLIATLVQKSSGYRYRVAEISDECAELVFFEGAEEIGRSEFTIAKAQRAGLVKPNSGWAKYPEAMLFARALTQGVRWFCPDVTAGSPAYTPEELGADVDERGEIVAMPVEAEVVTESATPKLDAARVERLEKGIELAGLKFKDLDLLLGSVGIDALRAHSAKARRERLESLSTEQADALEVELNKALDKGGES